MSFLAKLFGKNQATLEPKAFDSLNENLAFVTDTATLAIFDPEVLHHRFYDDCDWWSNDFTSYDEVMQGFISLVSLPRDGQYRIRFTSAPSLTEIEKQSIKKVIEPLGIKVSSGKLFVGGGEYIPGENYAPDIQTIEDYQGTFIPLPPKEYDLTIYAMAYDKPRLDLADIIIQIRPRQKPFPGISEEPKIS